MIPVFRISLIALLLAAASPAFCQSKDDLPSAPSAVNQPKPAPKPAPPTPPASEPATAPAQATPAADLSDPRDKNDPDIQSDQNTIRVPVNEVNVVFTVTDKHNHYVKDLTKVDFKVVDDDRPVDEIRSFRRETDLPLQVGLLIDASNSIRERFKFEQESAIEFLNDTIRPRYDKAFVIGFDIAPELTQDFTDSSEKLSQGVRALQPGNATAMYDAIYYACRDKLLKSPQQSSVRRAIVLVSDGNDNASHVTREEAIEMAQKAEVIVYTISTNISGVKERGDRVLERISDATGGRAFFPFKIQDVADAFSAIQDELRSQYALVYKPADLRPDGRFRNIDIVAENKKNLHVRARKGYFAPNQ